MKRFLTLIFMVLCGVQWMSAATGNIKGKVVDASTKSAVDYADVVVSDMNDKVIASGLVNNGSFQIEKVPTGDVMVMVRLIGYDTYISDKVTLHSNENLDLGTIELTQLSVGLEEVTVTGEKNQIVYKLDRQSISASSSATSAGGTAVDVLQGTPSVVVDSDGALSLRGSSNFLVYVDGKLSPLEGTAALQQIPAGTINDIEIITTPSARYKTDGDVGIINITTKRSRMKGWSGLLNGTLSTIGTYSIDAILNYQTGKHNFYFGVNKQEIQGKSDFNQKKQTDVLGIYTESDADGKRISDNMTQIFKGGWQFADGKHHNLSIDLQTGFTSNWRGGDLTYTETRKDDATGISNTNVYTSHDRYNLYKELYQASLDYVLTINSKNSLILSNRFRYDSFSREYTESNMFDMTGKRYEGTRGYEQEHHWDCDGSLTYRLNYSKTGKLELGYQYTTYSEHGNYKIKYWDRDKEDFIWQDDLATPFYYRRQVHSGYAMLNDQIGKVTFDAGVRADRVLDYTDIGIEGTSRDIKRFNVFPSGHVSYDAGVAGTFSAGYSYRTNRPGIWQLEPYITYEDYYTKKIGNPDIRPEYTHSIEAGWRKSFKGGNSVSITGYYRYRKDISGWIRRAYEPGVTLDSIANEGNQIEKGIEFNGVFHPTSWWTTTLNGSAFHFKFIATNPVCTDRKGWYNQLNWINAFNVAKNTRLQLDGHYVGPKILSQGKEKGYAYVDVAARQQLCKGKLTLSIVAHDVLHTARYYNTRETTGLYSATRVRPVYPNIVASISYNFNSSKHKASNVNGNLFEGKDF